MEDDSKKYNVNAPHAPLSNCAAGTDIPIEVKTNSRVTSNARPDAAENE